MDILAYSTLEFDGELETLSESEFDKRYFTIPELLEELEYRLKEDLEDNPHKEIKSIFQKMLDSCIKWQEVEFKLINNDDSNTTKS